MWPFKWNLINCTFFSFSFECISWFKLGRIKKSTKKKQNKTNWGPVLLWSLETTSHCKKSIRIHSLNHATKSCNNAHFSDSCPPQKTVNTWKISGMLIVYWPITSKFRIRKQTSKPQTYYRCCLRFSNLTRISRLIGLFLATQQHFINISGIYGVVSFTVKELIRVKKKFYPYLFFENVKTLGR